MFRIGLISFPSAGGGGGGGGGGGSGVMVYRGISTVTTNDTVQTHSNLPIGTAAADRLVVAVISAAFADTISSVTIGGSAATDVIGDNVASGDTVVAIYQRVVASGTTATVEITSSRSCRTSTVSIYTITGLGSTTAEDAAFADGGAMSVTLTNTAGATIIAVGARSAASDAAFVWTNLTEDAEAYSETLNTSTASTANAGANATVSYTITTGANEVLAAAAWF